MRSGISSSLTPLSATALILTLSPARCAASIPFRTLSSSPQRVMVRNLSASSVSSETLMRLTPSASKLVRVFCQLRTVCREREFVKRAALQVARERRKERHHAAPYQRLTAGEPKLADAARDEYAAEAVEFFQGEQVGLRQKRHVFRHAVDAAEVAAVCHRDAQIADLAAERVDERIAPMCTEGGFRNRTDIRHYDRASRCHGFRRGAQPRGTLCPTIWQLWPISTTPSSGTEAASEHRPARRRPAGRNFRYLGFDQG